MAGKQKSLEQSFEQLEQILAGLEDKSVTLEQSFSLYSEGMKVLKSCNDSIDKIEKKLIILQQNKIDE